MYQGADYNMNWLFTSKEQCVNFYDHGSSSSTYNHLLRRKNSRHMKQLEWKIHKKHAYFCQCVSWLHVCSIPVEFKWSFCNNLCTRAWCSPLCFIKFKQQQQQQHSLLSLASWGRLDIKPKRSKGHSSGTLIASLQALLSKATSLEIFHSLMSLLTDSSQVSLGLPLPLFTLSIRFRTPLRTGASGGLRWTCPNYLNRC